MARLKFLLAFLAMLICFGGVAGAYFYWKKFAQPEIVVTRHISGKGDTTLAPRFFNFFFRREVPPATARRDLSRPPARRLRCWSFFPGAACSETLG